MSLASFLIKHEIARFECVHPLIYAAYDVLDKVCNPVISDKIRNHLIAIEDSFVNSQEWTLCRSVIEVRLGVIGSQRSGKSALVHHFLTGFFLQDDSPEGGRFKKLCFIQAQPCLLLIRDEPGPPDVQLSSWIDALIVVVDLSDLESIRLACSYYALLCDLCDFSSIPVELVAIRDLTSHSSISADVVSCIHQLLSFMRSCPYYEVCPLYGINVESAFHDILSRAFINRSSVHTPPSITKPINELPADPCLSSTTRRSYVTDSVDYAQGTHIFSAPTLIAFPKSINQISSATNPSPVTLLFDSSTDPSLSTGLHTLTSSRSQNPVFTVVSTQQSILPSLTSQTPHSVSPLRHPLLAMSASVISPHASRMVDGTSLATKIANPPRAFLSTEFPKSTIPECCSSLDSCATDLSKANAETSSHANSSFTPRLPDETRPHRPRPQSTGSMSNPLTGFSSTTLCTMGLLSNSGTPKSRDHVGAGRLIPLKQGYLYKHKTQRVGKEVKRKKKYVIITADARLSYHPSKQDYISGQRCKSIDLTIATVKLPGLAYRMSPGAPSLSFCSSDTSSQGLTDMNSSFILPSLIPPPIHTNTSTPNASAPDSPALGLVDSLLSCHLDSRRGTEISSANFASAYLFDTQAEQINKKSAVITPQGFRNGGSRALREVMKRHYKKTKTSASDNSLEYENQEFLLVTADNTQWHFEASSTADRDDWIHHIDYVIHQRLRSGVSLPHDNCSRDTYTGDTKSFQERDFISNGIPHTRPLSFTATTSCLFKDGAGEDVCDQEEVLQRLTTLPGNDYCADCGAPNPEWASLSLVVLVCIECSGVHRELGTHISRVRSAALDIWTREHLAVMVAFGNTLANSVWEGSAPSHAKQYKKPEPGSSRDLRTTWIQSKYVHRLFLPPLPLPSRPIHHDIVDALFRKDMRTLLLCLALCGATPGQQQQLGHTNPKHALISAPYSDQISWTSLHLAASLGDLASTQLLLWHGADISRTDHFGLTAWSYAHICHQDVCARLLQLHGCRTVPVSDVTSEWFQHIIDLRTHNSSDSFLPVTASTPTIDKTSDSQSCGSFNGSPVAQRVPVYCPQSK